MKKVIRLTESDLARIVKRVIKEQFEDEDQVTPEMIIRMLTDSAESTPQENYDDPYDWMQDVFSPVESELEDMGYDIDDLRMTYDDVIMSLWDDNYDDDDDDWDNDEWEEIDENWSQKYKRSIDCNNPKGFSQKAHCQGRKKRD